MEDEDESDEVPCHFCGAMLLFVGVLCCADSSRMTAGAAAPIETKQQASAKAPAGGTTTPTSTPTPIPTCPPNPNPNYVIAVGTGVAVPGTVDIGSHCDDCTTYLTLPFPYKLYDTIFTGVNVSSNGNLQFDSNITGLNDYINACLPVTDRAYSYTIFAFLGGPIHQCFRSRYFHIYLKLPPIAYSISNSGPAHSPPRAVRPVLRIIMRCASTKASAAST